MAMGAKQPILWRVAYRPPQGAPFKGGYWATSPEGAVAQARAMNPLHLAECFHCEGPYGHQPEPPAGPIWRVEVRPGTRLHPESKREAAAMLASRAEEPGDHRWTLALLRERGARRGTALRIAWLANIGAHAVEHAAALGCSVAEVLAERDGREIRVYRDLDSPTRLGSPPPWVAA